jgi:hypothetical protein
VQKLNVKIHYRTLTDLYSTEDQSLYNAYTLLKAQCEGLTHKPGFLNRSEIKKLTTSYNASPSTIYGRLNKLAQYGYIQKSNYGYTLTSTNHINNNLNNLKQSKTKTGRLYHPYASIQIPMTNNIRVIELTRAYLLLKQIFNRKSERNGLNVKNLKSKNAPETITIALEYLRKAGKYNSKMTVSKLMDDLQTVGLLKIKKGKFNNIYCDWYDTNQYEIMPFKNAVWSRLPNSKKIKPIFTPFKGKLDSILKKKTTLTDVEKGFINFIEMGKSVLVVNGFIPYSFLTKKIRKNMIPNILNKVLADEQMKNIFLSVFKKENVMLLPKSKVAYDSKGNSFDRYSNTYYIDNVVLVDQGGNYSGRVLSTHEERLNEAIQQRIDLRRYEYTSHLI